jgi:large subunit ribosomal protein L28
MARVCEICGKRTHAGRSLARRGKAKYLGGVGIKTTGVTRRQFKPNIQRVKALVDGKIRRLKVCTQCIRSGKVVKPTRKYVPKAEHEAPAPLVQVAEAAPTPEPDQASAPADDPAPEES